MPTPKQFDRMAAAVGRNGPADRPAGPGEELPEEYWAALLNDAAADGGTRSPPIRARPLSDIGRHVLRVSCTRCGRIVEVQTADAVRLFGPRAVWKNVGQRLLDDTCPQRTGRHEEDGCWPAFD